MSDNITLPRAAQQALDWLYENDIVHPTKVSQDLRTALEQQQAEPVWPFVVKHYIGERRPSIKGNGFDGLEVGANREDAEEFVAWVNAHIIAPPQRPWVGLTDAEIEDAIDDGFSSALDNGNVSTNTVIRYVRIIEAKLKGKNT